MIQKGARLLCAVLKLNPDTAHFDRTSDFVPVEVREVRRDHATQEPHSVRVRLSTNGKDRFVWVAADCLKPFDKSQERKEA